MEEKDFRIGNWVLENGSYRQIEADDFYNPQLLNPIPLTEEILLKCGAKKSDDSFGGYIIYYPNGNGMRVKNNEWSSQHLSVKLEYLHQLQNLYFALTNEELKINL